MPRPWTLPVSFSFDRANPVTCEIASNGLFVVYLSNKNGSTTTIGGGQVEMVNHRYVTKWRDATIIDRYEWQILGRINGEHGDQ